MNAELPIPFDGWGNMEVDLLCADARLVVELDGGQHLENRDAYRRDRRKDALLQERGYFVLRFLAEDVGAKLDLVLDAILRALAHRSVSSVTAECGPAHEREARRRDMATVAVSQETVRGKIAAAVEADPARNSRVVDGASRVFRDAGPTPAHRYPFGLAGRPGRLVTGTPPRWPCVPLSVDILGQLGVGPKNRLEFA